MVWNWPHLTKHDPVRFSVGWPWIKSIYSFECMCTIRSSLKKGQWRSCLKGLQRLQAVWSVPWSSVAVSFMWDLDGPGWTVFVTLSSMTSIVPSFLCENKPNTTERGAAEVMFEGVTEITWNFEVLWAYTLEKNAVVQS